MDKIEEKAESYVDRNYKFSIESPTRKKYESLYIAGYKEAMRELLKSVESIENEVNSVKYYIENQLKNV